MIKRGEKHKKRRAAGLTPLERLKLRLYNPRFESLEDRLAPAVFSYAAPAGQPFESTLRLTGADLELTDGSGHLLAQQSLSETTRISITGSDQASSLTVDESVPFALPITFDTSLQSSPSADSLHLIGANSGSATYAPGVGTGDLSSLLYEGSVISFGASVPLFADNLGGLTFISPGSADEVVLSTLAAGQSILSGTSAGVDFGSVTFNHVSSLTINASRNSSTTGSDTIQVVSTSDGAAGMANLDILTGVGGSQVVLQSPDLSLPAAGGTFQVSGGSGHTSLTGPNAQNAWNLAANGGTLTSAAGGVAFSNVATLIGGNQTDTFAVGSSSTFGGTLQGGGGGDTFNIDLSPETGSIHVDETGASGTNTLAVQSLNLADQLTDTGSSVVSSDYATTYYSGPVVVSTSVITDLDSALAAIFGQYQSGLLTGTYTYSPGSVLLGGIIQINNPALVFQNIQFNQGGTSSGTVAITAASGSLFPGQPVYAQLTPSSGSNVAISGSYDLATGLYSLDAEELSLNLPDLTVSASGLQLSYNPNLDSTQQIARISNVAATLPVFGGVGLTLAGLTLYGNGFSIDNASVTVQSFTLSSALSVETPTLSFNNVNFSTSTSLIAGTINVSATAAALFAGGQFSGSISSATTG